MDKQPPQSLKWNGTLPPGVALERVEFQLAHTRTRIIQATLDSPVSSEDFQVEGSVARVLLSQPLVDALLPTTLTLRIRFEGEPPRPLSIFINGDKPIPLPNWIPAEYEQLETMPKAVAQRLWALELKRVGVPAVVESLRRAAPVTDAEVFAERALAVQRGALLRQAFLNHDALTSPKLNPAKWANHMVDLNSMLGDRIHTYALMGKRSKWPKFNAMHGSILEQLRFVSAEFRTAFVAVEAYEAPMGTVDLYDWAFEHFVTGALATQHNDMDWQNLLGTHGTPDSTYLLRYAALAIVAIESDVDADFWLSRLPTLARAAHIYLELAAPLIAVPYPSPESEFRFNPGLHYPTERRRELRDSYNEVSHTDAEEHFNRLRARFASLVGRALCVPGGFGAVVPLKPDIPSELAATLRAQGVGDPYPPGP